ALVQRLGLDPRMQAQRRVERRLGLPVAHQLERPEEASAANVADVGVASEALAYALLEQLAHRLHAAEHPFLVQASLHGECAGARRRMAMVRGAMLEEAA